MSKADLTPPERGGVQEAASTAAEAVTNMIPVVGGALAVLVAAALRRGYERRLQDWMRTVIDAINGLQDRVGLDVGALSENEEFLDAIAQATRGAERTHREEKLHALRNAVVNTLLPDAPDADEQAIFFALLDDYTVSHLRVLSLLSDPGEWYRRQGEVMPQLGPASPRDAVVEQALPELAGRRDLIDKIVGDLYSSGLLALGPGDTSMTGMGTTHSATTAMGNRFLAFITDQRGPAGGTG